VRHDAIAAGAVLRVLRSSSRSGDQLPITAYVKLQLAALFVVLLASDAAAQAVTCSPHSYPQRTDQSLAVDPFDDRIVYVGVEGEGFFKTTDDGRTWRRIVDGIRAFAKIGGGYCYSEFFDTAIDPRNPEHVCIAMAGTPGTLDIIQAAYQGVYCSNDGGSHWEQRVAEGMNTAIYVLAIDPTDSATIYAGSNANAASFPGADPDRLFNRVGVVHNPWTAGSRGRSCRPASCAAPASPVCASTRGHLTRFTPARSGCCRQAAATTWIRSTAC
jgi:hypothetical protein